MRKLKDLNSKQKKEKRSIVLNTFLVKSIINLMIGISGFLHEVHLTKYVVSHENKRIKTGTI